MARSPLSAATLALLVCACTTSRTAQRVQPPSSGMTTAGAEPASQGTVGLRIAPNADGEQEVVHLVAVVVDVDGNESETVVGDYPGHVVRETHRPELESATIEHLAARRVVWIVREGDYIEVRRHEEGEPDDVYEVVDRVRVAGQSPGAAPEGSQESEDDESSGAERPPLRQ